MYSDTSGYKVLEGNETFLVKILWERLNPSEWPLRIDDFPPGSFLVGGAIRDGLIGKLKEKPDLDFVVHSDARNLARNLAIKNGGTFIELDAERDIARWVCGDWTIDIASQIGVSVEDDLCRRDFTLNSIALSLDKQLKILDPMNGIKDLRNKTLTTKKEQNLVDDPLRLLRALRFQAEFDFKIEKNTREWIKYHRSKLFNAAPERIQAELMKLVCGKWAEKGIQAIWDYKLLDLWLCRPKDSEKLTQNLSNAKNFTPQEISMALPLSRLTTLLNDEGLENLRFSRKQKKDCTLLRKWISRYDGLAFQTLSESDRLQLHKDLEKTLPAIILILSPSEQIEWLRRWRNKNDSLFHPASPIDGLVLQNTFGLLEGPKLGRLLDHLSHERAFGRLHNKEKVFTAARLWLQQNVPRCD